MSDEAKNVDENDDLLDEETAEFITLDYEDGGSERCEVLGIFELDGAEYIALGPEDDDDAIYLYAYLEHEDGTFSLGEIDDEKFAAVGEAYENILDGGEAEDEE